MCVMGCTESWNEVKTCDRGCFSRDVQNYELFLKLYNKVKDILHLLILVGVEMWSYKIAGH